MQRALARSLPCFPMTTRSSPTVRTGRRRHRPWRPRDDGLRFRTGGGQGRQRWMREQHCWWTGRKRRLLRACSAATVSPTPRALDHMAPASPAPRTRSTVAPCVVAAAASPCRRGSPRVVSHRRRSWPSQEPARRLAPPSLEATSRPWPPGACASPRTVSSSWTEEGFSVVVGGREGRRQ
uniref:Uncharacterized protein n=1 Tax=Arundo donax TaxID=35708 RepID=A0A0A9DSB4_ARUDO